MAKGHFLNPHLDNSHDGEQKNYRVLNLLYYVSPDWKPEFGGNLELWDESVKKPVEIPSLFNRLVLMSTNDKSWHSVNEVRIDRPRRHPRAQDLRAVQIKDRAVIDEGVNPRLNDLHVGRHLKLCPEIGRYRAGVELGRALRGEERPL